MEVNPDVSCLRNVGIMAHIDAGKTTTSERILYYTKRVHRMGEVDKGTATMDWMTQEQERGITITSAATSCSWKGYSLNLIDTPGHVDFTVEVERTMRVLDGAVIIFCAVAGVEPQSETVWRQADRYHIPRVVYVNKMDRIGADFYQTLEMIRERFENKAVAIQMPLGMEDHFLGVIDLIHLTAYEYTDDKGEFYQEIAIPSESWNKACELRGKLIEQLAEYDDQILHLFLEGMDIEANLLIETLRNCTIKYQVVPVLCGSSYKNKGVQMLLDAIVAYLPSPLVSSEIRGVHPDSGKEMIWNLDCPYFSALVFKIAADPYVGKIVYLRVFSGTLKTGSAIWNSTRGRSEKVIKLLRMHANTREEIERVEIGDIAAVVGLKVTMTGDTLCHKDFPIVLDTIVFPEPVVDIVMEPNSRADEAKLDETLILLQQEDPSFKVRLDQESGQRILSGMGELHLEVMVRRILEEFRVNAKAGKPRVAYRETIFMPGKAEATVDRMVGENKMYAHLKIRVTPQAEGEGNQIDLHPTMNRIPPTCLQAAEQGVRETLQAGILAGFPLEDVKVEIMDGEFHEGSSNEQAFKMVAGMAMREALERAGLTLMEPIMQITILTPEANLGDVIADINSRKGHITDIKDHNLMKELKGEVPLAETFGYATQLRSLSQGRASFSLEPRKYAKVSEAKAKAIMGNRF